MQHQIVHGFVLWKLALCDNSNPPNVVLFISPGDDWCRPAIHNTLFWADANH
jgi:hypothetical protein